MFFNLLLLESLLPEVLRRWLLSSLFCPFTFVSVNSTSLFQVLSGRARFLLFLVWVSQITFNALQTLIPLTWPNHHIRWVSIFSLSVMVSLQILSILVTSSIFILDASKSTFILIGVNFLYLREQFLKYHPYLYEFWLLSISLCNRVPQACVFPHFKEFKSEELEYFFKRIW